MHLWLQNKLDLNSATLVILHCENDKWGKTIIVSVIDPTSLTFLTLWTNLISGNGSVLILHLPYEIHNDEPKFRIMLTHWGRVMHICVGKLTIIGWDNSLSPGRRQAIISTNAGILLIGPLGTNFSEILSEIQSFSFKKMHLKMSSVKWRPFCFGLNVFTHWGGRSWSTSVPSMVYWLTNLRHYLGYCCHVIHQWFSPKRISSLVIIVPVIYRTHPAWLPHTKEILMLKITKWNSYRSLLLLTHWGRVTHICVSKLPTIGSDNGLSPGRQQAII